MGRRDPRQDPLLCEENLRAAMAEGGAARSLVCANTSWCFRSDADFLESSGGWSPGDGPRVTAWPTEAPRLKPGIMLLPPDFLLVLRMDGNDTWKVGVGAASGKEAVCLAWGEMTGAGMVLDMGAHAKRAIKSGFDKKAPPANRFPAIIPALGAVTDAEALDACLPRARKAPPSLIRRRPPLPSLNRKHRAQGIHRDVCGYCPSMPDERPTVTWGGYAPRERPSRQPPGGIEKTSDEASNGGIGGHRPRHPMED